MRIGDLFYLHDKKILIVDINGALSDDSKRQLALAGASIIGPLSNLADALLTLALHGPDAAIIDVIVEDSDMVEIARRLDDLQIPFVFAEISARAEASSLDGFYLNGDVDELRKITQTLFEGSTTLRLH